jgi:hypothetical protein
MQQDTGPQNWKKTGKCWQTVLWASWLKCQHMLCHLWSLVRIKLFWYDKTPRTLFSGVKQLGYNTSHFLSSVVKFRPYGATPPKPHVFMTISKFSINEILPLQLGNTTKFSVFPIQLFPIQPTSKHDTKHCLTSKTTWTVIGFTIVHSFWMHTYDWLSQNAKWKLFWSRIWESIIKSSHTTLYIHSYKPPLAHSRGCCWAAAPKRQNLKKNTDFVDKKISKVLSDLCFSHHWHQLMTSRVEYRKILKLRLCRFFSYPVLILPVTSTDTCSEIVTWFS